MEYPVIRLVALPMVGRHGAPPLGLVLSVSGRDPTSGRGLRYNSRVDFHAYCEMRTLDDNAVSK